MARRNKRASMREGPLSDLFRSTTDDVDPVDPPEMDAPRRSREPEEATAAAEDAPRYGRQDPAEAQKAAEDAAPVEPSPAAGPRRRARAPEPVAEEPPAPAPPAPPESVTPSQTFFDQEQEPRG